MFNEKQELDTFRNVHTYFVSIKKEYIPRVVVRLVNIVNYLITNVI